MACVGNVALHAHWFCFSAVNNLFSWSHETPLIARADHEMRPVGEKGSFWRGVLSFHVQSGKYMCLKLAPQREL